MTALMIASRNDNVNMVNALANAGADLEAKNDVSCLMF